MATSDDEPRPARPFRRRIGRGLTYLFGKPAWGPPPWARAIGRGLRRFGRWATADRPRALALALSILLTVAGGMRALRWWDHRPKPVTVAWELLAPELTPIEEKLHPRALRIEFEDSVAPLDKIGKPVTAGVTLEVGSDGLLGVLARARDRARTSVVTGPGTASNAKPPDGVWRWASDRELTFTPKIDWPVGQELVVRFAKKGLVAGHIRLARTDESFKTAPFEVRIADAQFYQDPVDPTLKKVVATFKFTHPVDPATFETRVKLHLVPTDKQEAPTDSDPHVTYDRLKGAAFVHSGAITIPRHDAVLWVTLAPGAAAARGGPPDDRELTQKVVVPGLYNLLKVTSAAVTLVDNERYEPEQALIVETSVGVADKEITKSIRATLLPDRTTDDKPAYWNDPALVGTDVLARGAPIALIPIASEIEFPVSHSFKLTAPVGRQIYVQVAKGLHAFGGYVLSDTFQTVAIVPPYPPMLRILQNGALLAQSGDRKLPVLARDIPGIKYEIGRVLPGQIQHLITQSYGDFAHPGWAGRFDQTNVSEFFEETHALKAAPGKPTYDALDLSKYLTSPDGDRRGLFLLRAQAWDQEKRQLLASSDARLVLITDLGLLVKENADGSRDAFVTSLRNGDPVSGARVDVLGRNGQRVLDATTGDDGHAHIATFKDLHREKEPTLFLVSAGKDQSFLPVGRGDRQLDASRFDVGGVSEEPTSGAAQGLTAYLFSDRGIYRPGDQIRLGVIVKNKDWSGRLAGLPLELIITDARGLPVKDQKIKLGPSGFEEVTHTTPDIAPSGSYGVNLYVVKDGHPSSLLGSTTVQVREFLPDRMKIRAALTHDNPDGWVAPNDLKALVTLTNLYGTSAAHHKIHARLTLSPWVPSFGHFRDYRFFDPLRPRDGVSETLADASTGDDGTVEIDLGLQRFAAATYRLSLVAEGFEAEGGRSVVADVAAVVSPLPFLVGYKADGELAYLSRGEDRHVQLVAVAATGHAIAVDGLHAVLFERKYVSVLVRQDNGTYRYQSVRKDVELSSRPLTIAAAGVTRKLASDRPGDFALVIRDAQDKDLQRIEYAVTGYGNLSREVEKNAELQIALKHGDVAPGDEIEMQIKAPYAGTGLITVERDRVYAWKWFKATATATVEHIRVPDNLEGGGYVSVSFVRDPASDEIFMSPLSHGIVPFSISRARRQVAVDIDTPELARPGAPFRIKVHADKPSQVVVFAVDEGILHVAGYQTPDPLGFWFQKRALSVRTSQILDLILPDFERLTASKAPGGDQDKALGANLNPFRRKQQKPIAFWSGIVDVGGPGHETRDVVYDVPDYFNGTLRVMAVAVAPDALGAAERRALVRGDFVIAPNVPAVLAPGDQTDVSVSVANNVAGSGADAQVTLALAASDGVQPIDGTSRAMRIPALGETVAHFKVRARPVVGPATLTFTATMGSAKARLASEISIRPATPYLATFQAGRLRDRAVTVPVARKLYAELRHVEAGIAALPLGLTHGLRGYLDAFPHGCTEQIVSQAVPPLVLGRRPEFGYAPATSAAAIDRWIGLLRARQNDDGSFGRWAANPDVDPLASVWAAHMLLEAKERGVAVPTDMSRAAVGFLQTLAAGDAEGLGEAGVHAYATYVLTRTGMQTATFAAAEEKYLEANHPKEWRHELAGLYLAATYRLLKQDRAARDILDAIRFGQKHVTDPDAYTDRLAFDAQALYVIARHFPERAARVSADDIDAIVDPIFRGSFNTYSSAWAILALETYAQVAAGDSDSSGAGSGSGSAAGSTASAAVNRALTVQEIVGGQPRPLTLPRSLLPVTTFSPGASAVRFSAGGPFGAFWVLGEAGFDATVPDKPQSSALEVFRAYEDAARKPVTSVKLGDEITAVVRVRTIGRPFAGHLAIVDLLPGGFEPVIQAPAPPSTGDGDGDADESSEAIGNDDGTVNANDNAEGEGAEAQGEATQEAESQESRAPGNGSAAAGTPRLPGATVAAAPAFALSIALPGTTFVPEFGDAREDRVVFYGPASTEAKEIRYAIKATNVGTYVVPPIQASALYDSTVFARGAGGSIAVVPR